MKNAIVIKHARFKGFEKALDLLIGTESRHAIIGPKRNLLIDILGYHQVPDPPTALSYPCIDSECWPSQAIQTLNFTGNANKAPYLAARFESFRDEFDYTLDEILGQVSKKSSLVARIKKELHLNDLGSRWIVGLSNGQTRRAQLAQALLKEPKILLVEDPFMGLDPENKQLFDQILGSLKIPVVLSLASPSDLPEWITDVVTATDAGVKHSSRADFVPGSVPKHTIQARAPLGREIIRLDGVSVSYRGETVIKNLTFSAREGERVHIKGPNGSGKSTLLAMITADHPQSWNEKLILFGIPREVGKQSYASINADIGFSSPELHSIFPLEMSCYRAISTGFSGNFVVPQLDEHQLRAVDKWIKAFNLPPSEKFGQINTTQQKLVLLARALVKDPKILLLDEAFSTLDETGLELAFNALDTFKGTVLLVSHSPHELPPCDQVLDLGRANESALEQN